MTYARISHPVVTLNARLAAGAAAGEGGRARARGAALALAR